MTILRISKLIFSLIFFFILFSSSAQTTDESYKAAIESADKYFKSKDFIKAKTSYQYANRLKPDEQYPKDKIKEVLELLRSLVSQNNLYAKTIINADKLYDENKYNNALTEYQNALKIFPDKKYPKDRISEINKILADEQANIDAYNQAILNGNNFFKDKDYENAKIEFQIALSLISGREYPKQKIDEINLLLAELEVKQEQYDEVIANAEKYLQRNNYKKAKIEYEKASIILPDKKLPKDKIAELNPIIEKQENYDKLIDEADNLYIVRDFNNSKEKYFEAAKIFPDDRYPKDMIEKINLALANKATTDKEDYDNAIANGDRYFSESEYTNAKNEFEFASRLKPDEQYPKDKISEINIILEELAAQKSINENYLSSIERADNYFNAGNYESAESAYKEASEIKPGETYPNERINEIHTILADLTEQQNIQQNYILAITKADNYFDKKNYVEASKEYQNAVKIKADEQYPKNRIEEINSILDEIAEKWSLEENYNKAIADGDNYLSEKDYENALIAFNNSAKLKPEEQYPKNKITEINNILTAIVKQKAEDEKYNNLIEKADELFNSQDYDNAKIEYQNAGIVKPNESYPNDRISEINNILDDIAKYKIIRQEKYEKAISDADNLFVLKKYEEAKIEYQNAVSLKNDEQYPINKINEIDIILAEIAEQKILQDRFYDAIAIADSLFFLKEYELAKTKYADAGKIKPGESFPNKKINEINNILLKIEKEKQKAYELAIVKGDNFFNEEHYEKAQIAFKAAANIKPDEQYPKEKILELNSIIAQIQKARQQAYDIAIADADKFYNSKIYDKAIQSYLIAAENKTDETYPIEMINKITKIISENVIVDINKEQIIIPENTEQKFSFKPVPIKERKSNYILLKAKNTVDRNFKVILNYGKDNSKSGGTLIKIPVSNEVKDYIIRIGAQYKWFSEDNNWLSLYPEGGEIEVSLIQISKGD